MSYWGIIPAAGDSKRTRSVLPKQYFDLNGKTVIEHSIEALLRSSLIKNVVVVLNAEDFRWELCSYKNHPQVLTTLGGAERSDSVLNGLEKLSDLAQNDDWVLVHDGARPCLSLPDLEKLISEINDHPVGGLLGVKVSETVKQCNAENKITHTLNRDFIWRAQTPQMFRYGLLKESLIKAKENNFKVTDEASAVEFLGHQPVMVEGSNKNIKITHLTDLALAEFYLRKFYANRPWL